MKKRGALLFIPLLVISLVLSGCTTMADAVKGRNTGMKVAYQASFEEIWAELPAAVTAAGLEFVSADLAERQILAQRGVTLLSVGENVAIFVEKSEGPNTTVEVVSRKAVKTNVFAPNWARPVFIQLDKRFNRV